MNYTILMLALLTFFPKANALESSLADCEKKIFEIVAKSNASLTTLAKAKSGSESVREFHLSQDQKCALETVPRKNGGIFNVSLFKVVPATATNEDALTTVAGGESIYLNPGKFETLILHQDDPTFTRGRIKSSVFCSVDGDHVRYEQRIPVFSDGNKSPFNVKVLDIGIRNDQIEVSLVAKLGIFVRSVTRCSVKL